MTCLTIFCSSMYSFDISPKGKGKKIVSMQQFIYFMLKNLKVHSVDCTRTPSVRLLPFASLINHEIGRYTHEKNSMEGLTRYSLLS